jgi:hypothetical protein
MGTGKIRVPANAATNESGFEMRSSLIVFASAWNTGTEMPYHVVCQATLKEGARYGSLARRHH